MSKRRIVVTVYLDLDTEVYAETYGLTKDPEAEALSDAPQYAEGFIYEGAKDRFAAVDNGITVTGTGVHLA